MSPFGFLLLQLILMLVFKDWRILTRNLYLYRLYQEFGLFKKKNIQWKLWILHNYHSVVNCLILKENFECIVFMKIFVYCAIFAGLLLHTHNISVSAFFSCVTAKYTTSYTHNENFSHKYMNHELFWVFRIFIDSLFFLEVKFYPVLSDFILLW